MATILAEACRSSRNFFKVPQDIKQAPHILFAPPGMDEIAISASRSFSVINACIMVNNTPLFCEAHRKYMTLEHPFANNFSKTPNIYFTHEYPTMKQQATDVFTNG